MSAAPFTPGSIVAYRVGDATTAPSTAATPVYLDEYAPDGSLLQTLALPVAASGANNPLTATSTGSEGLLNRSVNGLCLTVPGYAATPGTTATTGGLIAKTGVQRDVAFVDASGAIDTSTTLGTTAFIGSNIRGAVSDSCARVWLTGNGSAKANYGVWYAAKGASGQATQLLNTNSQGLAIANGQLYASLAGGGTLSTIGSGLPTSGTQTATAVAGIAAFNYRGTAFLTLQAGSSAPDTLYLINNNAFTNPTTKVVTGALDKYSLCTSAGAAATGCTAGTWSLLGRLDLTSIDTAAQTMQGLLATPVGDGNVVLYFTDGKTGIIYRVIDDSGATGTGPAAGSWTTFVQTAASSSAVVYGLAPSPVTALPGSAPNTPQLTLPSSVTPSGFTASWTPASGGAATDAYVVEVATNSTFAPIAQTLVAPGRSTSVTISGVNTGAPLWYRVRAFNSVGASPDALSGVDLPQTVSFGTPPALSVGGVGTVSAAASSGLPVALGSLTPAVCSISGSTVTGLSAGTCTLSADQAGNTEYAAASEATLSFTIGGAAQSLSFGAAPQGVVVGATGTLTATASSGLPVTFSSQTPGICSVAGALVSGLNAGVCTVAADQPGNASFLPAAEVLQSFTIGQAAQSITFGAAPSLSVNTSAALAASASSGLAVSFASTTPLVCSVSGSNVIGLAAGTCTIAASQAGNSNFAAAATVTEDLIVGPGSQTITFNALPVLVAGGSSHVNATASSALPVSFSSATPSVCSVSGNTVTAIAAGTCTVAADQSGNSNYNPATTANLTVTVTTALSAFTPGSLVINTFQGVNNGGASLDSASPVILQQFQIDATGSTASQTGTLILPQSASGNQSAISGEYGSASEGLLQQSANGAYLTLMGYGVPAYDFNTGGAAIYGNAALGQSTSLPAGAQTGTVFTTVPRVVALVGANASVDTSTALLGLYNQNNPRSVATVDGTAFWTSGQGQSSSDPTQGVAYAPLGASTATTIDNSTDTRVVSILNRGSGNALYVSRDRKAASGPNNFTNISVLSDATGGLPTSTVGLQTSQLVPPASPLSLGGNNSSINLTAATANGVNNARIGNFVYLSPEQYYLASPTVLYVADSGQPKAGSANAAGLGEGGLQKWILVNGVWTLAYDLVNGLNLVNNANANANTPTAPGVTGLIALTGRVVNGQVQLFAASYGLNELSQSYLYEITDALDATSITQVANEQFKVLFTDPSGQTLVRGVAFAPGLQQTLSFGPAPAVGVGGSATVAVSGGGSSSPVLLSSLTPAVCLVGGTTVTGVSAGTCTLVADQAGDASYSPAAEVSLSFAIGGAAQTISVDAAPSFTVGSAENLLVSASSGLPVTVSSLTPSVCSITGNSLAGLGVGICTLAFDQAGNTSYAAAPELLQSFTVVASTGGTGGGGDSSDSGGDIPLLPGWAYLLLTSGLLLAMRGRQLRGR